MNITCPACSATFQIDPARVPSEGMMIRCPECAHSFEYKRADAQPVGMKRAGSGRLFEAPAGMDNTRYFVKRPTGKVFGPFDVNAIRMMIKADKLSQQAEVSTDQTHWMALGEVPAIADLVDVGGEVELEELSDEPPASLFGGPSPGGTMLGHWSDSAAEEIVGGGKLTGDDDGEQGPHDRETRGVELPPLPGLKSAKKERSDLPQTRGFDLPKPASRADLPGRKGLADLRSRLAGAGAGSSKTGEDLPRVKPADLPGRPTDLPGRPSDLPGRPSDLPGRPSDLPGRSSDLPGRLSDLPELSADLPGRAADLPGRAFDLPGRAAETDKDEFFNPTHSDLFSAPDAFDDEDDLFGGAPETFDADDDDLFGDASGTFDGFRSGEQGEQRLSNTSRYEDGLFGDNASEDNGDESGFDMGGARPAADFGTMSGFQSTHHQDISAQDQESDILSGSLDDDDLFAAPGSMDDRDRLFETSGSLDDADDLFAAPNTGRANGDLFAADSLDLDASMDALGEADSFGDADPLGRPGVGDDFLSQGNSFSFLDEPSEEHSAEVDLAGMSGEWGDDLMSDAPMEEAFDPHGHTHDEWAPGTSSPSSSTHSTQSSPAFGAASSAGARISSTREVPADGTRQPASAGIRAATTREEAVAQDKKRGSTMLLGAVLAGVLVLGGASYALYSYFGSTETPETPSAPAPQVSPTALDIDGLKEDTYQAVRALIDQGRKGKLGDDDGAKLLVAEALLLARYDNPEVREDAQKRAESYQEASDGWAALARGAWEASEGNADAARAYLEPLIGEDTDRTYWAQLMMGIGDILALKAHLEPPTPQEMPDGPPNAAAKPAAIEETPDRKADEKAQNAEDQAAGAQDDESADQVNGEEKEAEENQASAQLDATANRLVARARGALEAAEKTRADWPVTDYWRGRLFELSSEVDQAVKAWEHAIQSSKTHVASQVALAGVLYGRGDLNGAIAPLQTVTEELAAQASDGERADAQHYLGLIYAARQERDEAISALTTALSIDVGRSDTIQALAEQYMSAQKYQEALNFFTTNKNLGAENPDVMLGIVRAHMGLEQWDEATKELQRGGELFPNDARFPLYLGRLHRERGAFFDARKALSQAITIDGNLLSAHAALAHLIWLTDKDEASADEHIAQIEANPALIDAAVGTDVADYYRATNREESAERWYQSTLKRFPNYWPARLALARVYLDRDDNKAALELLERAQKEGVKDLQLSAYLADAYRQSRQFSKAVDQINAVLAQQRDSEEYIFIRGRIYFDQGSFENAERDFNQAYQHNPRFHQAYFYVGRTAFAQEDYGKAMKIFRHVLDYEPNNGEFHYWMGRAYEAENRQTSALNEYRRVTVVDEDYARKNPSVYVRRGEMLSRQGYPGQGKQDISQALEIDPQSVEARVAMGNLNFREKQYEEAIDHFQRAIKLEPELADVQYRLGMSLMYHNQEVNGAEHLQLAVRYGYEDPKVYQTLGYLYKRMGKNQAAIDAFKKYLAHIAAQKSAPVEAKREMIRQIEELGGRL